MKITAQVINPKIEENTPSYKDVLMMGAVMSSAVILTREIEDLEIQRNPISITVVDSTPAPPMSPKPTPAVRTSTHPDESGTTPLPHKTVLLLSTKEATSPKLPRDGQLELSQDTTPRTPSIKGKLIGEIHCHNDSKEDVEDQICKFKQIAKELEKELQEAAENEIYKQKKDLKEHYHCYIDKKQQLIKLRKKYNKPVSKTVESERLEFEVVESYTDTMIYDYGIKSRMVIDDTSEFIQERSRIVELQIWTIMVNLTRLEKIRGYFRK